LAGVWHARVPADAAPIPVSLEKGIARTLNVGVGDRLDFEIQGVPLVTQVASLREVDWQRLRPNFFVVFPEGVLEAAPQFFAITARVPSAEVSAAIQRALLENFSNVAIIDLSLVLRTLEAVLDRVLIVLRFVALFTIVTGIAVLVTALLGARRQRAQEAILLRVIGVPKSRIVGTILAEYAFLGVFAALGGGVLSLFAIWALSYYFVEATPIIPWGAMGTILLSVLGGTVAAGAVGSWGILARPPLDALRVES
ncbi:MAG TPA: FtsX-like permease family protein, partial [Candidatus Eisenbacteria bacterium]|nr:FtsX-like permease family protein [Candidatus Eisenbacteria bacterium]